MVGASHIYVAYSFLRETDFYGEVYIKEDSYIFSLLCGQCFCSVLSFVSRQCYCYGFVCEG